MEGMPGRIMSKSSKTRVQPGTQLATCITSRLEWGVDKAKEGLRDLEEAKEKPSGKSGGNSSAGCEVSSWVVGSAVVWRARVVRNVRATLRKCIVVFAVV